MGSVVPFINLEHPDGPGLDLATARYVGTVCISAKASQLEAAVAWTRTESRGAEVMVEAYGLDSEALVDLMNAGASKVMVTVEQVAALSAQTSNVSPERLVLQLPLDEDDVPLAEDVASCDAMVGGYVVPFPTLFEPLNEFASHVTKYKPIYLRAEGAPSRKQLERLAYSDYVPIVGRECLTMAERVPEGQVSLTELLLLRVNSDRNDGLIPTVVVSELNTALGLVYSSAESVAESLRTGCGVYMSRKRGLWYKGATSGDTQELVRVRFDCDADCLEFVVRQKGRGFCHLERQSCFGPATGIARLQQTLQSRLESAPPGSYTARLFSDEKLLRAKIAEEADELSDAKDAKDVAWEMADLVYFAMVKCVAAGVSWQDVESELDAKSRKVSRRKGDAKPKYISAAAKDDKADKEDKSPEKAGESSDRIALPRYDAAGKTPSEMRALLTRPVQKTEQIMALVKPIVERVKHEGDKALLELTQQFDRVSGLEKTVLTRPFAPELMQVADDVKAAIDVAFENVKKFHEAQVTSSHLRVETMPGVVCSRFARAIERVGLYVPGGTAVLPSTTIMLGVPAMVAGCKSITIASPPRQDGTVNPEIVYIADKIGADTILLAGGAQAIAAMAYGTETVPKCDKLFGPGNQFVTAGKMYVQNDTSALVAIDMPAGPSEVLVIADAAADPAFVASDLLSQAEHGVDSQVVLVAIALSDAELVAIEDELHKQALALPRVDVVRQCIAKSVTLRVSTVEEAFYWSNEYAPEHLILQIQNAASHVDKVQNAGSVFVGPYSPESCGDYASGTNHSLPTYGYARCFSGVSTAAFQKHITSQELTPSGLKNVGPSVMRLAAVEGLDAHRLAVKIRLDRM